ncbi:MAG: phosphate ABC transporter substrate-binding protein PstS [Marmoricola sp.]
MNVTSLRRVAVPATAALALSLSLAACGSSSSSTPSGNNSGSAGGAVSGTVNGAGSTAQQAAQGIWAAGVKSSNPNLTVNYAGVGSGGGVTQFNAGGVAFAGSDSALKLPDEVAAAKSRCGGDVIEAPDYVSAIAVAYNVPGVKALKLDAATIAKIFLGKITNWNDAAIKALNPGVTLPSLAITPIHRSDKSGTTKNFTDYLNKAAGGAWAAKADSVWPTTATAGSSAKGTSGVVSALQTAKGGIAYVDDSQAGSLSKASIKVGSSFVQPSAAGAAKDVALSKQQPGRGANDFALSIERNSTDPTAYPITLVSYLIACPTYPAAQEPAVKAFLSYVVSTPGQQAAAANVGSAPLPAALASKAQAAIASIKAK